MIGLAGALTVALVYDPKRLAQEATFEIYRHMELCASDSERGLPLPEMSGLPYNERHSRVW